MTTDDTARAEAWADYAQTAHLRARSEPVGDLGEARARFELIRHRIVSLMTDLKLQFDAAALAPPPAVPDEVRRALASAAKLIREDYDETNPETGEIIQARALPVWRAICDAFQALAAAPAPAEDGERRTHLSRRVVDLEWRNRELGSRLTQAREALKRIACSRPNDMNTLQHLADAPAPAPAVPDERLAELRDWFEESALNLQAATPDGNNPARYKGPHPCDCAHFADDAIAQVRSLLAASAQPAEDKKRDVALSAAHDAWDAQRTRAEAAERRIRELEEALRELYEASRAHGFGKYKRLIAAERHAGVLLQGGDDDRR
jgi:hypothetical protein